MVTLEAQPHGMLDGRDRHLPFLHNTAKMTETDPVLRRKPLVFVASARKDLQGMPDDVQDSFGFKFDRAQIGRHPMGGRPFGEGLPTAILKLTADESGETYRAAYVVAFAGVVYVLDVFQKGAPVVEGDPTKSLRKRDD